MGKLCKTMGNHKITEDWPKGDDSNQPKHSKTKGNPYKAIGNHKIAEERTRADD